MRRLGLTFLSTSALAAAATVPAGAAPPPPVFSWTGFYIGANAGYSWGRAKVEGEIPGVEFNAGPAGGVFDVPGSSISDRVNLNGWIGGGQIGYNWQTAPNWLWGLEADIQGSGEKGDGSVRSPFEFTIIDFEGCCLVTGDTHTTYEAKIKWFGTVRARTGFIANNLLFYGTGGLAYGRVSLNGKTVTNVSLSDSGTETFADSVSSSFSAAKVKVGWTAGAGIEGMLWDPRWTWKVEYLFMDLGKLKVDGDGGSSALDVKFTDHIVRFGLNFRN